MRLISHEFVSVRMFIVASPIVPEAIEVIQPYGAANGPSQLRAALDLVGAKSTPERDAVETAATKFFADAHHGNLGFRVVHEAYPVCSEDCSTPTVSAVTPSDEEAIAVQRAIDEAGTKLREEELAREAASREPQANETPDPLASTQEGQAVDEQSVEQIDAQRTVDEEAARARVEEIEAERAAKEAAEVAVQRALDEEGARARELELAQQAAPIESAPSVDDAERAAREAAEIETQRALDEAGSADAIVSPAASTDPPPADEFVPGEPVDIREIVGEPPVPDEVAS